MSLYVKIILLVCILTIIGCESNELPYGCKLENRAWVYRPLPWSTKGDLGKTKSQGDTFVLIFISDSFLVLNDVRYKYYKPQTNLYKLRLNPTSNERRNLADFRLTKRGTANFEYIDMIFGDTVNLKLMCD